MAKTGSASACLVARDLTVGYGTPVASNISFELPSGTITGLVGTNGAGKSTLAKTLVGVLSPLGGSMKVEGRLGYMPQHASLDWDFPATVGDLALMGRTPLHKFWPSRNDKQAALTALERAGMADLYRRPIGQLSGGQRQRTLLARTLALEPDVLILDEPFAGVDAASQASIISVLHELRDEGLAILIVHHTLNEVREISDLGLLLADGRLASSGPVDQALAPEVLARAYGFAA